MSRTTMRWFALLLTAACLSLAAPTDVAEVLLTQATLLGGLDTPCTPNATTVCEPSVVDAAAWCRAIKRAGIPHAFFPTIDRNHILTKLHPKDWGANFALHEHLNVARALVSFFSFTTDATLASYSVGERHPRLLDNFDFPVGHNLRPGFASRLVDVSTKIHFVAARRRLRRLDDVAAEAAITMQKSDTFREQQSGYRNTLLFVSDSTPEEFAIAVSEHGVHPDIICRLYAPSDSVSLRNATWLVNIKTTKTHLHRLVIHRQNDSASKVLNVTLTAQPLELPPAMRTDPQYVADRAMMKAEALIAAANNPVQGSTAGPMPAPTAPDGAALCRRGECAMGNLFADAVRYVTGTDIALFSGSWLKGPGWAAGDVFLKELYDAYGFIEMGGKVTVLGLSLFELWNHSLAASAFDPFLPTTQSGARHLPQVSGMRVKYNLARADVNNRLVSIEVWDRALNEYRPLERLKKYTVSGMQFLLHNSAVHSVYLKARYAGERSFSPVNQAVQNLVGTMLARTNGQYTPGIFGRMIEDNASEVSMKSWNHAAVGCAPNLVLSLSINTCVACPTGTERPATADRCVVVTAKELATSTLIAVVAGSIALVLLLGMACSIALTQWRRHKRTRYCPRNAHEPIAAFFVTVRNEVAVRERYPATAHLAFKQIEDAVAHAANNHKCFVARRLGAHFLVVGSHSLEAVRAAGDVQLAMEHFDWNSVLGTVQRRRRRSSSALSPQDQATNQGQSSYLSGQSQGQRQAAPSAHLSQSDSGRSETDGVAPPNSSSLSGGLPRSTRRAEPPMVSAGLCFGPASIAHDDEFDTWVYSGAVVDAAASVADAARPGQFLATDLLVQHAGLQEGDPTFVDVHTRDCAWRASLSPGPKLLQMNAAGCQRRHFDDVSSESETAGALTAALEVAAGGLTSRTVGAVCWSVPALRSSKMFECRSDHAKHVETVLTALSTVTREFQADLTSASDGAFLSSVNGAAPRTAQVAMMTAALARAGVAAVQEATTLDIVAGAATGPAMTGALNSTIVVSGVATERARLLATIGHAHAVDDDKTVRDPSSCPEGTVEVLVSNDMLSDLDPHFVLAAVDAIAWPDHCVAFQKSMKPPPRLPVCVYAVVEEKAMNGEEWLYQLADTNKTNPYAHDNALLTSALNGHFVSSTPRQYSQHSVAAMGVDLEGPSESTPELPVPPLSPDADTQGHRSSKSASPEPPAATASASVDGDDASATNPRTRIGTLVAAMEAAIHAGRAEQATVLILRFLEERTRRLATPFAHHP